MARLSELLARKAALDKEIEQTRREEREAALNQIRQLMSEYGLTLADLSARGTSKPRGKTSDGPRAGTKVAAKYRDATTGDTWSGRGLQPRWLKAALASGRKLGDFAV